MTRNIKLHSFYIYIGILFFRPRLNILIFLLILAWKYPCIILKLYLKKKKIIMYFLLFNYFFCAVYYRDVFHVPFIVLSLAMILYSQGHTYSTLSPDLIFVSSSYGSSDQWSFWIILHALKSTKPTD